jgi:hypothetical protein
MLGVAGVIGAGALVATPLRDTYRGLLFLGLAGVGLVGVAGGEAIPRLDHVDSLVSRIQLAGVAVNMIVENPLTGVGFGQFNALQTEFLNSGFLDLVSHAEFWAGGSHNTFLTLLAEGAMSDWSAVYLRRALETSPAMASTGYAAFSTAMAAGRLGGDRVAERIGRPRLVRWGSALASAGLGGAVLLPQPWAAVAGFATMGVGLANVIPILFGAAGRQGDGSSGSGIAAVTTTGYIGLLSGPPLIGWVSEWIGLPLGMGLVAVSVGLVAVLTVLISPAGR